MKKNLVRVNVMVVLAVSLCWTGAAQTLFDNFDTNPINTRFTLSGSSTSQNSEGQTVPSFSYENGTVIVNYNSFQPWARLARALPVTVDETDRFRFGATFTIRSEGLVINDIESYGFQFATFALVNSSLTGQSRDGGDAYSTVEFDYFPQDNTFFDTITLGPAVIAGKTTQSNFFGRIFFDFGPNTTLNEEIRDGLLPSRGLPLDTPLLARIEYDGSTNPLHPTVSISVSVVTGSGPEPLPIGVPVFDLTTSPWTDFANFDGFSCDMIAILNYQEYPWTTSPSHIGTVVFDSIFFEMHEPTEPPIGAPVSLVAVLLGGCALLAAGLRTLSGHRAASC